MAYFDYFLHGVSGAERRLSIRPPRKGKAHLSPCLITLIESALRKKPHKACVVKKFLTGNRSFSIPEPLGLSTSVRRKKKDLWD